MSITDEIIDAIIQNENRHVCRPPRRGLAPQAVRNRADLKPDWGQLPPGAMDAGLVFPRMQA